MEKDGNRQAVLFVCRHNSCRSQMAEGILRATAGDRFEVYSAGLESREIHPLVPVVMREIGIDISGQRSKSISEYLGKLTVNHAIVVCHISEDQCPKLYPFALQFLRWPFDDPTTFEGPDEATQAKFREVRDQIVQRIEAWLRQLGQSVAALPVTQSETMGRKPGAERNNGMMENWENGCTNACEEHND